MYAILKSYTKDSLAHAVIKYTRKNYIIRKVWIQNTDQSLE